MTLKCQLALYFFYHLAQNVGLEIPPAEYSRTQEEVEAAELAQFVESASALPVTPHLPSSVIRISRDLQIYIGNQELKLRPMSKAILLLFLLHPEGIELKRIADYEPELTRYYSRLSRSDDKGQISRSIGRVLDVFSNELNVNLSRVNSAISALEKDSRYLVKGQHRKPKTIPLNRSLVIWE